MSVDDEKLTGVSSAFWHRLYDSREKVFDLSLSDIMEGDVPFLTNVLSMNPHIEEINLSENDIGDIGIENIGSILNSLKNLRVLNVAACEITDIGLQEFFVYMSKSPSIHTLNISRQDGITKKSFNQLDNYYHFSEQNNRFNTLKKLIMQDCNINDEDDLKSLGDVLKLPRGPYEIDLWGNGIQIKGYEILADALAENKTLVSLNLKGNKDNDKAPEKLKGALITNPNIMYVYPVDDDIARHCYDNKEKAYQYLLALDDNIMKIQDDDLEDMLRRLPSIVVYAEKAMQYDRPKIARFLMDIEEVCAYRAMPFSMPSHYVIDCEKLRSAPISSVKAVDFSKLKSPKDLFKEPGKLSKKIYELMNIDSIDDEPLIVRAIKAGQTEQLFDYLYENNTTLSLNDYLFRAGEDQPAVIQHIMHQHHLLYVFRAENWIHNPGGPEQLLKLLPEREVKRQLSDEWLDKMKARIGALSVRREDGFKPLMN